MIPRDVRKRIFDCYRLNPGKWNGDVDEIAFLRRLWNLSEIRSTDGRFSDAEGDIYQHRYNNDDWDDDWVFSDSRFALESCSDDVLVRFVEETVHPVVRQDGEQAAKLVGEINEVLRGTVWELGEGATLAGRTTWRMRNRLDDPDGSTAEVPSHLERRGFVVGKKLGWGASGEVFKAEQQSLNRTVAVKICTAKDSKTRKRFEHEARILAKIQHPAIPYVITRGSAGGTAYTVMQYVDGRSVRALLEEKKRISREDACRTIRDVLSAVSAAHRQDLVHRDIKPENILVDEERAFLIDFSIGAALEELRGLTRVTTGGNVPGTVYYTAPEVLAGKAWDTRIDLYATGAVLFEMLTGKLWVHAQGELLQTVDPQLAEVIRKACASEPDLRFQTAGEFSQAVLKALTYRESRSERADAFCASALCPAADWSSGFAPTLKRDTNAGYCRACGTALLYECSKCSLPIEPGGQYCSKCGTAYYKEPRCKDCEEPLRQDEVRKGICRACDSALPF